MPRQSDAEPPPPSTPASSTPDAPDAPIPSAPDLTAPDATASDTTASDTTASDTAASDAAAPDPSPGQREGHAGPTDRPAGPQPDDGAGPAASDGQDEDDPAPSPGDAADSGDTVDTGDTGDLVVRARGVTHAFEGDGGVHGVDLDVPAGRIFGLVGPSGSGKTTMVRLVLGLLAPEEGTLEVLGSAPSEFGRRDRTRMGYLPQASALDPSLSLRHNLDFMASQYGVPWRARFVPGKRARSARERIDRVLELVDLQDVQRTRLRDASGGEQRRLGIAAALVHEPELLVLDEPTAGIDPVLREQLWEHFSGLRDAGHSLFVTTQYVAEADACDLVGLLVDGRMLQVDTPDGLRRTAFGGELVEMAWEGGDVDLAGLTSQPGVRALQRRLGPRRLRLVVESADQAAPGLQSWLAERGAESPVVTPHKPSFDEVFVRMVQDHRESGGRRPLVAASTGKDRR